MIYSFTTRQAAKVFKEVENAGTDSIFIAGGPHPSGSPEETLEFFLIMWCLGKEKRRFRNW